MTASEEKPPIWIVRGNNWTYVVASDKEDLDFPYADQAIEVATKAMEIAQGAVPKNDNFVLDDNNERPLTDVTIAVQLKDSQRDTVFTVETYIALANGGFYRDSVKYFNDLIDAIYLVSKESKEVPKEISKMLEAYYKNMGLEPPEEGKKPIKKRGRKPRKKN